MVGYADRQFLALLKPVLDAQFHWLPSDYGWMTTGFQIAIAVSLLGAGWFLDRVGLRWGFAIGLAGWSLASGLHAAARTVPQFIAARVALGIFESVGTPAGMKALASFFGAEERAMTIGIVNAAPNIATIVTPLVVSGLYVAVGWQWTILCLAGTGFICLAFWLVLPFDRMAEARPGGPPVLVAPGGWMPFRDRNAWVLATMKLLTDQAWWFMLFWLPDFLHRRFDLDMRHLGAPVAVIYAMATAGGLIGGAAPRLIKANTGLEFDRARAVAMAVFAVLVIPIAGITWVHSLWPSVLIAGLALACHQGFSANVFALAADIFPAARIATAIGFAAFFGNIGGAAMAQTAGLLLEHHGTLTPMFFVCASGYSIAWMVMHLFRVPAAPV